MEIDSRADSTPSQAYLDANIGYRLTGVAIAMLPITAFFLILRFYSRSLTRTPWGLDDALAAISGVVTVGLSALAICFVKYGGVGHHLEALALEQPSREPKYFIWLLIVSTYYYSTVAFPKLAVLALYGRLWTVNPYRTIILVLGAVISLTAVVSDVVMLAMPVPIVWNLNVSMKVKLGLTLTFATGFMGLVTSIMRFVIFARGNAVKDGSWSSTDLMAWSVAEPDIYLISACLPTLRPILYKLFGKDGSTANSTSRYGERYGGTGGSRGNSKANPTSYNETGLYGDEVQLVSVVGKESKERMSDHGIYVQREVNVEVSEH
ncbi:hypothetical protein N7478_009923 [Penicillium angulare]|uniref:uncharacterized protein n=1 Tax=Penicillium angulare TaxID=116970 RepID=UPI00254069DC|nr:uncharacterized protein N7478_009923 [Penicillium angulare]KAJ5267115.1 hypothetical protein N7478_009923 [Penicillium angulare]